MFFYEGCQCPVCGKPFQETDDIVVCPQCGAPHHRECWKQEGHCHFESSHGTGQQWKRPEPSPASPAGTPATDPAGPSANTSAAGGKTCPYCGYSNTQYAEFCSRCGREIPSADWNSQPSSASPPVGPGVSPPAVPMGNTPRFTCLPSIPTAGFPLRKPSRKYRRRSGCLM